MSVLFDHKDRRVIPNFRSLNKTIFLGELNSQNKESTAFIKNDLSEYIQDFKENQTLAYAGDLISAAVVNNEINNPAVQDAAKYILDQEGRSTFPQLSLAAKILNIKIPSLPQRNIESIDEFLEENNIHSIRKKLRQLKDVVNNLQSNPFVYVELARLYSIIGQQKSSLKNILIAKSLAPLNRYVLRSFARLMAHYGDIEQAHDTLRKCSATKFDPWLLASEIAFASLRKKNSNLIKNGLNLIDSRNLSSFSLTELASSIATVELINGNRKKSLALFGKALISPNDNSLAQIEWANNKADLFDLDLNKFSVQNISEAETLSSFNDNDFEQTIKNAERWFIDMPFAKRPITFGAHASGFYLEDHDTAIKFCKAGLISNPQDPQIINNIAYSYALKDDANSAFLYLNKIDVSSVVDDRVRLCLIATTGLAYYKAGQPEKGRELYMQATLEAMDKKLKYYYAMALMHLTREEIYLGGEKSSELLERVRKIDVKGEDKALEVMKTRVLNQKEKHSGIVDTR